MWDNETGRLEIRDLVFGQLDISHPITYRQYDLCGTAKQGGKLKSQFKIKDLIEIGDEHNIEPLDPKSGKDSFFKPLQSFIEQCVNFKQKDSTAYCFRKYIDCTTYISWVVCIMKDVNILPSIHTCGMHILLGRFHG